MEWATSARRAALAAALLSTTSLAGIAFGQDLGADGNATSPALAQGQQPVDFDIPAQPLSSALTTFGTQSGYQVSVDQGAVSTQRSAPVSGRLAPDEALRRMLAGTGLSWRFTGSRSVFLTRAPDSGSGALQLDPVQVQGFPVPSQAMIDNVMPPYAGGQVATGGQLGLLGNRPVMDTPFNQTSYTAKKAQDQQAKTIRDVLIDDPSVRSTSASNVAPANNSMSIRGFVITPTTSTSYGGLYGLLPNYQIPMELAERVEVLKGPSVMLNGMPPGGSIGGTVNVVPKRAPDEDLTQLTANYVSAGQFGGHADIARRFGPDKQFGVRFNGVIRAGQTPVENGSDEVLLGTLGLDFRGERVRLSGDLGYQYQYIGGLNAALGVANNVQLPWAPNARKNQGQPWSYNERKDLFGVVRGELDVTERITAYAAFGAHDYRLSGLSTTQLTATSFYGAATSSAPQSSNQYFSNWTGETGLRALVDTGPIGHEFAFTATTFSSEVGVGSALGTTFASNIYNPTIIARPTIATPPANKTSLTTLSSLGIADTLSAADKRVQLTVGARLQRVQAANYNGTTGVQTDSYDQSALSPAVALIFKPWETVSVYGNWIQGLQQGVIVGPTFSNAGEIFPPYKATQFEVGVKADWGKLTTTASLFQISQPSILTNTTNNTQFLGGEQINQGLELNVFGEPLAGVRLLGGVMFLNAVLAKTQGGLTNGWIAPFSPGFNLNLAGEWDLPFARGMTLNGRVIYTGSQYIDTTWPRRSLPEWTRFDIGARYTFENPGARGKLLVARLDVENVLDANFWQTGLGTSNLYLGAPRTFRLSLTADF